jgi:hypothetical protein
MMASPETVRVVTSDDDEHVLIELDGSGDKRIKWKLKDPKSIARAKARFEKLKANGYAFFRVRKVRLTKFPESNGTEIMATKDATVTQLAEGEELPAGPVRRFEPADDEITAVPPRRGG